MRSFITLGSSFVVLLALGCGSQGTQGGPGASDGKSMPAVDGPSENAFTLAAPVLNTTIQQGESKNILIGVRRGKNFAEDIKLEFSNVPKGIEFTPASETLTSDIEDMNVTLKAAEDASIGDFVITVSGRPSTGKAAANEFRITVTAK